MPYSAMPMRQASAVPLADDDRSGVWRSPPTPRNPAAMTGGVPHAIASNGGDPETLVDRGRGEHVGGAVELDELGVRDPPEQRTPRRPFQARELRLAAEAGAAGERQPPALACCRCSPGGPLTGRPGPCAGRARRRAGRSGRRGRSGRAPPRRRLRGRLGRAGGVDAGSGTTRRRSSRAAPTAAGRRRPSWRRPPGRGPRGARSGACWCGRRASRAKAWCPGTAAARGRAA